MSDQIKHECAVAVIRLLKPLEYYQEKYGTALWGISKLRILLQKQRNRGQDGAGFATIKMGMPPGKEYINIQKSVASNYIDDLFMNVQSHFNGLKPEQLTDPAWLKMNRPFTGELLLGHLRYGTHGDNSVNTCHPFLRQNNWITRNLVLAGNFNLTNVDELFDELVTLGQYPTRRADTVTVLEKIGHFLDDEVQRLHTWYKPDGYDNIEINDLIYTNLDIQRLLRRASKKFDGGYVMAGLLGHGDAFIMRDPNGIRPAFYYQDEEVVVMASERPAIQTAFDVHIKKVKEIQPGHALIIKRDGRVDEKPFTEPQERRACSFERIYFSRGSDRDIYLERKKLGELLTDAVLEAVDYDFKHTVFSFIPNTAEAAYYGLMEGIEKKLNCLKQERLLEYLKETKDLADINEKKIEKILSLRPRMEKLVVKDEKLRTFITDTSHRGELVSHVYDVTYGIVENEKDTLVLLDDSIVRGTTMRDTIVQLVARLRPKKILVVSSAPQIRFPDCYGIDMSIMKDFVAFQALLELLKENKQEHLLQEAYHRCVSQDRLPKETIKNEIIALYNQFSYEEVSKKIAKIITPAGIKPKVEVIFQTIEDLHKACPNNNGDWYFSGNYPTPGGNRVANRSFINFVEKRTDRAY